MDELRTMFSYNPLYTFYIGNFKIGITTSIIVQWVIILVVAVLCIVSTRNLKKIPDKKQSILEVIVEFANNQVKENMGDEYSFYTPYIGTVAIYVLLMNLTGVIGIDPPTQSYSVALGMAATSFVVVQANAMRKIGVGHYFTAFTKPIPVLTPMNLMERVMFPVSLSLRLFGNIVAASVIMKLIYIALGGIKPLFAQLLLPVPLHAYFDIFDGTIQAVIFVMLTMINIKVIAEH